MAGEGLWWIRVEKGDILVCRRREKESKSIRVDEETREMRMRMRDW
jgi:hypothetical protein